MRLIAILLLLSAAFATQFVFTSTAQFESGYRSIHPNGAIGSVIIGELCEKMEDCGGQLIGGGDTIGARDLTEGSSAFETINDNTRVPSGEMWAAGMYGDTFSRGDTDATNWKWNSYGNAPTASLVYDISATVPGKLHMGISGDDAEFARTESVMNSGFPTTIGGGVEVPLEEGGGFTLPLPNDFDITIDFSGLGIPATQWSDAGFGLSTSSDSSASNEIAYIGRINSNLPGYGDAYYAYDDLLEATMLVEGPSMDFTFTHPDNSSDEDCITDNVCLTRGQSMPVYNSALENASDGSNPAGTEWALGSCSGLPGLSFYPLTSGDLFPAGPGNGIVGTDMCLHLTDDGQYYNIRFTQWTKGNASGGTPGGGFAYTRDSTARSVEWTNEEMAPSSAVSGKFRIVLAGTELSMFYWDGSGWAELLNDPAFDVSGYGEDVLLYPIVHLATYDPTLGASVDFDNFEVQSGLVVPGYVRGSYWESPLIALPEGESLTGTALTYSGLGSGAYIAEVDWLVDDAVVASYYPEQGVQECDPYYLNPECVEATVIVDELVSRSPLTGMLAGTIVTGPAEQPGEMPESGTFTIHGVSEGSFGYVEGDFKVGVYVMAMPNEVRDAIYPNPFTIQEVRVITAPAISAVAGAGTATANATGWEVEFEDEDGNPIDSDRPLPVKGIARFMRSGMRLGFNMDGGLTSEFAPTIITDVPNAGAIMEEFPGYSLSYAVFVDPATVPGDYNATITFPKVMDIIVHCDGTADSVGTCTPIAYNTDTVEGVEFSGVGGLQAASVAAVVWGPEVVLLFIAAGVVLLGRKKK